MQTRAHSPHWSLTRGRNMGWFSPADRAKSQTPYWDDQGAIATAQGKTAQAAGAYGDQATAEYWNRAKSFDPSAAINRYAQGAWNQTIGGPGGFNDQLTKLRGNQVAGGRLDTGFNDEDTGMLYRSTVNDFGNNLAQTAVQGAGLELQNNRGIADFGSQQQGLNLDLQTARREELIDNAREKAARKRQNKRGIAGAIGGALGAAGGFLVGGPAGAVAGYGIGRGIAGGG